MLLRRVILLASLVAIYLSSLSVASAASSNMTVSSFASIPRGSAFGDYALIATGPMTMTVGPTALVDLACNTSVTSVSNSATISSGSVGSSGTGQSTITTSRTTTSDSIVATSDIQNFNLLNGLISAARIHTSASSIANSAGATSSNNSTFTSLNVAGQNLPDPHPNTVVNLPGVGYVVLNEQTGPVNGPNATSIDVYGLDVHITLGVSAGSRIVFGKASTSETRTVQPDTVTASAYSLYATGLANSNSTSLGPISPSGIGCAGGFAQNSTSGFNSSIVGNSGTAASSSYGEITSAGAYATSHASLTNPKLLNNLISASSLTSVAMADWNGTGSRSGSMTITSGKVAGIALSRSPNPNTRINLSGLGYVIVNEQFGSNDASGASETTIAFDIHITQARLPGLPNGARIIVGTAIAKVSHY